MRNYRSTPHSSTGKSPAELLMGRQIKTKLPEILMPTLHPTQPAIANKDSAAKRKVKYHADKRSYAKPNNFSVGDSSSTQTDKFTTPFRAEPCRITEINGSMITATSKDQTITRNSSHFKLLPSDMELSEPSAPKERDEGGEEEREKENSELNDQAVNMDSRRYPVRSSRNTEPNYKS